MPPESGDLLQKHKSHYNKSLNLLFRDQRMPRNPFATRVNGNEMLLFEKMRPAVVTFCYPVFSIGHF